jgi:hypothetical protein
MPWDGEGHCGGTEGCQVIPLLILFEGQDYMLVSWSCNDKDPNRPGEVSTLCLGVQICPP